MSADAITKTGAPPRLHTLKCHAENFDAIESGHKRFEVRHEHDRIFKAGDRLILVRTDVAGVPTSPRKWVEVEVLYLARRAGPLQLLGVDVEASSEPFPIVVMSIRGIR
jgi:hypothetical protein